MPLHFLSFYAFGGVFRCFSARQEFFFEGNSLGVVLTELCPLLRQSLDWFGGLVREREIMSEVRSSELDTGLSSSGEPVEGDTAISTPREVRAFYALEEACGLDAETVARFKDRFQFPARVRVRRPSDEDRACHFFPGRYAFMRQPLVVALGSSSIPSSWSCWIILALLRGSLCRTHGG